MLNEIRSLLEDNIFFYALISGDFNTDLNKTVSNITSFSILASEHLNLTMCHSSSKVLFSFERKSNLSRSLIDHFFVSESLFKYIYLYMSQHESDNFSDHCPVSINLIFRLNICH